MKLKQKYDNEEKERKKTERTPQRQRKQAAKAIKYTAKKVARSIANKIMKLLRKLVDKAEKTETKGKATILTIKICRMTGIISVFSGRRNTLIIQLRIVSNVVS